MIVIIVCLLFSLYMYWHFENRRKVRNAQHHREKREALFDLLTKVRKKEEATDTNNKKEEI